jgi:hypothetical protein
VTEKEPAPEIVANSHRELARNLKEIVRRFNENPDVAKRVLMNPIYALEEIGVKLNKEMRDHVRNTFNNPPAAQRRREALEAELKPELERLTGKAEIPASLQERAQLVFGTLKLKPIGADGAAPDRLDPRRLSSYAGRHPIIAKLLEYEAVRKGGLPFLPRAIYDSYRRGERRQEWVDSVTFKL